MWWYIKLVEHAGTALLIFLCILIVAAMIWRIIGYRKVKALSEMQKDELLNHLCNPLGYDYIQNQDLFVTRLDAWQRRFGYEAAFDELAVTTGMVFDCFPVYFDYRGRTWLLEFWKGQYGIAAGGEIGIYHADHIVKPEEYNKTHFDAASLREMLGFGLHLSVGARDFVGYRKLHWWLGIFRVGTVIRPGNLRAVYRIRFFDQEMKDAFVKGLKLSGYPMEKVQDKGSCVVRIIQTTETYLKQTWFRRLRMAFAMARNRIANILYHLYTIPFCSNEDRLLFLYFQLPFIVRRLFHIHKYKKCRRNHGRRGRDHGKGGCRNDCGGDGHGLS